MIVFHIITQQTRKVHQRGVVASRAEKIVSGYRHSIRPNCSDAGDVSCTLVGPGKLVGYGIVLLTLNA